MTPEEYNAVFKLPFNEASSFFRDKLSIPTERYSDMMNDAHAKGFMVAGAYKADLLADFRGAVQKSIDGNMSLKEFRGKFDEIVAKHGWSYNGGRNWRSELIWDVNITSAYNAGRWHQFVEGLAEYLTYRHMDNARPRPLHVSWDGTTLPIGDPWFDTHSPQCGYGCHCRLVRAERSDYAALVGSGKGKAPQDGTYEWTNKHTGEVMEVPNGIDPGFGYNVGKAAGRDYRVLSDKFETLPNDISRAWMKEHVAGPAFARFIEGKIAGDFPVAVLQPADMEALGAHTQTVWFSQRSLLDHLDKHPDIGLSDYRRIPQILDEGEVFQQTGSRLIFLKQDGKLYRAATKTTGKKHENYFLTLFETTSEKALVEVRGKYKKIR